MGAAHSRLSEAGLRQALEMGERRRDDGISIVLSSDLRRALQTVEVALGTTSDLRVLADWRLRECDYGRRTRMPVGELHSTRTAHIDDPYPDGESWRQAIRRVSGVIDDVRSHWPGERVLIVGHLATRWALDHFVGEIPLETLMGVDFQWQPGWEYRLG